MLGESLFDCVKLHSTCIIVGVESFVHMENMEFVAAPPRPLYLAFHVLAE